MRRVKHAVARDDRPIVVREDAVGEDEVVRHTVARPPFSPAQAVSLLVGALLAVLGAVALARTGIDFDSFTRTHTEVAGMDHTALLGLIELVLGLAMIGIGAIPGASRGGMTFFGVLMLGFGIVVNIQPSSFEEHLGTGTGAGWMFIVLGTALLVAAMVSPVVFHSDRRAVGRGRDVKAY